MDIRCATTERINKEYVYEPDDWRIFADPGEGREVDLFVIFYDFYIFGTICIEIYGVE